MSLSAKIFIGLAGGILLGILFGETMEPLGIIGEAFIQLLQMSVLPFVTFSLIAGLGRLSYREALSLAKKCGGLLLLLWAIGLTMVTLIPLAFPNWESASFFSSSLVEDKGEVNFLDLYIPANPFYSLSNSIVPAVVLFSIISGVALIAVERKQVLLDTLSTILEVLTRITGFVIQLAPFGVFAISASAAGTMELEDLGRLQVYLLSYIIASLVLTFWVLPLLATNLTSLSYREVVVTIRSALITAFATGNLMVILPILTEQGRGLLHKAELGSDEANSAVEVIVPTAFTFPTMGLLLSLSFIPFAAWYVGSSLSLAQYPNFLVSGVVSFFGGSVIVAMPFLLNLLRLPADMFELFITVDVFTSRFGTLLAAMHIWTLALLGTCAMTGKLRVRWMKFYGYIGISVLVSVFALGGTRMFFNLALDPQYTKYKSLIEMDLKYEAVESRVLESPPSPSMVNSPERSRLDQIYERGSLRVCFLKDSLPWVFRNEAAELVGFDIDMAHSLAKELKVTLDFVPMGMRTHQQIDEALNSGVCDMTTGDGLIPSRTQHVTYSIPFLDTTVAFVVKDYRRAEFASWKKVQGLGAIKVGIPTEYQHYLSLVKGLLPQAKIVTLDSPRDYFKQQTDEFDALIFLAESGSAWTVVYPQFSVVVPLPNPFVIPMAYPMPHDERELVDFVNAWIELEKKEKRIDALFQYWISGQGARKKEPRWSVFGNLLN